MSIIYSFLMTDFTVGHKRAEPTLWGGYVVYSANPVRNGDAGMSVFGRISHCLFSFDTGKKINCKTKILSLQMFVSKNLKLLMGFKFFYNSWTNFQAIHYSCWQQHSNF